MLMPMSMSMSRETLFKVIAGASFDFSELALEVFAHQYGRCPAYRLYCDEQGMNPAVAVDWKQIPLMPIDAMKEARVYAGEGEPAGYFETSGTTAGPEHRGKHYFESFDLFDAATRPTFRANVLEPLGRERCKMVTLTSPVELAPHMAYARCLHAIVGHHGGAGSHSVVDGSGLRFDLLEAALASDEPLLLAGSTFAFVHAADRGLRARLPAGSAILHAGGFKGRCREMPYDQYEAFLRETFGVERVFNMYSMTEMSSQLYGAEWVRGPAWVRTSILDVETLRELPPGRPGHVAIVDLLNLDACAFFVTKDLAVMREDGCLRVLGRIPGAEYQVRLDAFVRGSKQVWSC